MPREDTQFKPGQISNPKGRPKGYVMLGKVIRDKLSKEEIVEWYHGVWSGKIKPSKAQESAGTWLTQYGWGKAPDYAPIEGGDPLGMQDEVDRELEAVRDELAARRKTKTARADAKPALDGASEDGATPTSR